MKNLKLTTPTLLMFAIAFASLARTGSRTTTSCRRSYQPGSGGWWSRLKLQPMGKLFGAQPHCRRLHLSGCCSGPNHGLVHWLHGGNRGRHRQHGSLHHQAGKLQNHSGYPCEAERHLQPDHFADQQEGLSYTTPKHQPSLCYSAGSDDAHAIDPFGLLLRDVSR